MQLRIDDSAGQEVTTLDGTSSAGFNRAVVGPDRRRPDRDPAADEAALFGLVSDAGRGLSRGR